MRLFAICDLDWADPRLVFIRFTFSYNLMHRASVWGLRGRALVVSSEGQRSDCFVFILLRQCEVVLWCCRPFLKTLRGSWVSFRNSFYILPSSQHDRAWRFWPQTSCQTPECRDSDDSERKLLAVLVSSHDCQQIHELFREIRACLSMFCLSAVLHTVSISTIYLLLFFGVYNSILVFLCWINMTKHRQHGLGAH